MSKLAHVFDRFLALTGAAPGVIVGLLSLGVGAEVLSRNLSLSGFYWMLEAVEYGLLLLTMLGAAYVLSIGRHVTVDIVLNALPPRARRVVEIAVHLVVVVVSIVIVYYGVLATRLAFIEDSTLYKSFELKEWIPMAVVPGGMALFAVEAIRRLTSSIRGREARRPSVAETREGF